MVAVIGYSMWQREYAADPTIVGSVFLNKHPSGHHCRHRAEAILRGSHYSVSHRRVCAVIDRTGAGEADFTHDRTVQWLYILGRIKPGVALSPLQAKMHAELVPLLSQLPYYSFASGREERIKRIRVSLTPGHSGIAVMAKDMVAGCTC